MGTAEEYDDIVRVLKVSVGTEAFTPDYVVHSASFGFMVDEAENVLSVERSFDEDDGVCLVLSPSQQCVYDEFKSITLSRDSLGVRFTRTGQELFGVGSVRFDFSIDDALWRDLRSILLTICTGKSFSLCASRMTCRCSGRARAWRRTTRSEVDEAQHKRATGPTATADRRA